MMNVNGANMTNLERMTDWLADQIGTTKELLMRENRDSEELLYHGGRLEALEDVAEQIDTLMEETEDE